MCAKCDCGCKKSLACDCDIIHEEVVKNARVKLTSEQTLLDIADFYKALSDSTRIKIIDLLRNQEMCVCDISVILNMTKSAVSHQLKYLRLMNLVKARREGKEVWYSLADRHVKEVFDISMEHILENED